MFQKFLCMIGIHDWHILRSHSFGYLLICHGCRKERAG